ncbi:MAG: hypothetical protein AABW86_00565 [Candidatus Micrarchaeota archaeon]
MAVQIFSNRGRAGRSEQQKLVEAAQTFVDLNNIPSEAQFGHLKPRLYGRLKDKGLVERITFARKEGGRKPVGMGKRDLIETALHRIDNLDPGPRTLEAFRIEDPHLVRVLEQRELLETVIRIAKRKRLMD